MEPNESHRHILEQQLSNVTSEERALEEMVRHHAAGDKLCIILHHVNNGVSTQPIPLDKEDTLDVIARLQVHVNNRKETLTSRLNQLEGDE